MESHYLIFCTEILRGHFQTAQMSQIDHSISHLLALPKVYLGCIEHQGLAVSRIYRFISDNMSWLNHSNRAYCLSIVINRCTQHGGVVGFPFEGSVFSKGSRFLRLYSVYETCITSSRSGTIWLTCMVNCIYVYTLCAYGCMQIYVCR